MFSANSNQTGGVEAATSDPYFNSTTLLLNGDGTNGAQNNTFIDSSTNSFTVTRSGTPTQGTFTPFSQTGWSVYFDGSSNLVKSGADTLTGDFTIEYWMYYTGGATYPTPLSTYPASNAILHQISGGVFYFYSPNSVSATYASFTPAFNTWYHIATVRSGSTVTAYVNGTALATTTVSGTLDIGSIGIGDYSSSAGNRFGGYISNLRIVKSAGYTGNFTPSTTPLGITQSVGTNIAAITNTTCLLTLQSNRFKDNSINNFTITPTGTPSIQAFSPFAPTAAYDAATVGGSMYFNGTTDYLVKSGAADTLSTNFTVECWVYFNSIVGVQTVLTTFNTSSGLLWHTSGSTFYFYTPNNVSTPSISFTFVPSQWYHLAMVVSSNTTTAYVNGTALSPTTTVSGTVDISTIAIGSYAGGYAGSYLLNGYISNLRIVKSALAITVPTAPFSAAGTSFLLSGTNAGIYDATAKNDIITVGNAQVSSTQIKYGTGAMYFDGTGDYLTTLNNSLFAFGTGNFTIECWVYLTSTPSSQMVIVSTYQSASSGFSFTIESNVIKMRMLGDPVVVSGATSVTINTWHHIAISRNGTSLKVFLDGVQDGSATNSDNITINSTLLNIGRLPNNSGFLVGYLDDLRITRYARYTTTFTPPTQGMIGQ